MSIPLHKLAIAAGVSSAAMISLAGSAQAFNFTTNYSGSAGKNDVFLESVVLENGEVVQDFSYIQSASIVSNDQYTGGNTGAASADKGDNATTGIAKENVTAAEIAMNLGNNNLNNIIDTEDSGSFQIDLNFDKAMDNLLIWERGMNSDLGVQALDGSGNLIGNFFKISRNLWNSAGFAIDTTEIGGAQNVGSYGINFASDLGVSGPVSSVRFFSQSNFNGPDWKFVGTDSSRGGESVPEPGLILGLSALGGVLVTNRRRRQA